MSIWQSLERQRGLRSFWINTRDTSSALNRVWMPLSLTYTVPAAQVSARPTPLSFLPSVKLLKSLTVANDVFCVLDIQGDFKMVVSFFSSSPHRWWVFGGFGRCARPLTGVRRGSQPSRAGGPWGWGGVGWGRPGAFGSTVSRKSFCTVRHKSPLFGYG